MLLEIAIADAYGKNFEYVKQEVVDQHNDLLHYKDYTNFHSLKQNEYSDDTQMSIAIAEHLQNNLVKYFAMKQPISKVEIANDFVKCFKRDQRAGYAKHFQKVLEEVNSGQELIDRIEANGKTTSNGGAMRACPIGLFGSKEFVKEFAGIQASITHEGTAVVAAQIVAVAVYYLKNVTYTKPEKLLEYLSADFNLNLDGEWDGSRVSVSDNKDLGMKTVLAALHCYKTCDNIEKIMKKAVGLGGDTDSVASIACGIASVSSFHTKALPKTLLNELENNTYGRDYLKKLDMLITRNPSL